MDRCQRSWWLKFITKSIVAIRFHQRYPKGGSNLPKLLRSSLRTQNVKPDCQAQISNRSSIKIEILDSGSLGQGK